MNEKEKVGRSEGLSAAPVELTDDDLDNAIAEFDLAPANNQRYQT